MQIKEKNLVEASLFHCVSPRLPFYSNSFTCKRPLQWFTGEVPGPLLLLHYQY